MIKEIVDQKLKAHITTLVLHDLPEWFGIPKATREYIENSQKMPFFAVYEADQPVGFVAMKETSPHTAEIYCMGIMKAYHRMGYGKALFAAFEQHAMEKGYKLLQVKTVEQGKYDIYDRTNDFYRSLGFYALEVFPTLWHEHHPCQVFVKPIASIDSPSS